VSYALRPAVVRVVLALWRAVSAYGALQLPPPAVLEADVRPCDGPPQGHPERLCPELPPSPVETRLWQELAARRWRFGP
jgi:hypothetical protein